MAKSNKHKLDMRLEEDSKICQFNKNKKKFHPHDLITLSPKNDRQREFLELYYSETKMILQDGFAGTGKTFLAMYAALSQVFDQSTPYDQLIIFRSAVEGRKIGFIKGSLEEKMNPYEAPYTAIVDELIETYNHSYENLKATGYLDFMLTSHQRGTTYHNTIMLIDEAQNLDASELKTLCTRVGENSKIIICGDLAQDDLCRNREKSGFDYIRKVAKLMPNDFCATVTYKLEDIVRSEFVKEFLIADNIVENQ